MKIILSILCVLLLIHGGKADQRYSRIGDYPNPNGREKLALSNDDQILILYGNDGKFSALRSYDLKLLYTQDFKANPITLEALTNTQKSNALIFGSDAGDIYLRNFTNHQQGPQIRLSHIDDCNFLKISPSPDSRSFAVMCEGKTQIFIGDLLMGQKDLTPVDVYFTVQAMSWHPTENKLAIAGFNDADENKYRLVVLDVNKFEPVDFSDAHKIEAPTFVDVQFSSDGSQLAIIIEGSEYLTILKLDDKTITDLVAVEATQLLDLQRSGPLLSAYDGQNTYVWVFDGNNYGKYSSKLKSAGLSKTGGYLYILDPLDNHIVMGKICKDNEVFIYESEVKVCSPCKNPCSSCFVTASQCSNCVESFFLDESVFTCTPCLQNCKTCINGQSCNKCIDAFYLEENTCKSCADKYTGCTSCDSNACSKCLDADNWILVGTACQCKQKFVEDNKKCVACPAHCSICKDSQTCTTCDAAQHRAPTPVKGKCECDQKYYEDADTCKQCLLGCLKCEDAFICTTCDAASHWVLDDKETCICSSGFIQVTTQCASCSSLIQGCSICKTATTCTTCAQGYDLNGSTCTKKPSDDGPSTLVIIIIGVGVLLGLTVGGYFIVKMIRKQRGKKVQTLLQSQAENESDEMR